jgi:hypothetical protein
MPDSTLPIDIPIADPASPASPWWFLLLVGSIFVIVAIAVTFRQWMPDDPMPMYFIGGAIAFAVTMPVFLMWLINRVSIAIAGGSLVVRTGARRKAVTLANLRANGMRLIDLTQHRELDTKGRAWSATKPNLKTGLYRLRNGDRALLVITDPHRVCHMRSETDALTLSLKRPEQLRALLEPES